MQIIKDKCVELTGKVDCLYGCLGARGGGVSNTSSMYHSMLQRCHVPKLQNASTNPSKEQSGPWIHNFVSLTKLKHTFKIAKKRSSAFVLLQITVTVVEYT